MEETDSVVIAAKLGTGATAVGSALSLSNLDQWLDIAVSIITICVGILAAVAWIYKIRKLRNEVELQEEEG